MLGSTRAPAARNTGKPRVELKRCIGKLDDADRLGHALLLVATIGAVRDQMSEAEQALREAEPLVTDTAALRKQAALAGDARTVSTCGVARRSSRSRRFVGKSSCVAARATCSARTSRSATSVALELDAGDLDAAIESLRRSVDGLRRINAPYGLEFRLSTLAVALAWRGDDVDILPLAREAFDHHRLLGVTFAPLMAAALQHARRDDARRAVLLAGYAAASCRCASHRA